MKIASREYKLMVDPKRFTDNLSVEAFIGPLHMYTGGRIRGESLSTITQREITFFDTPNQTLHNAGLILRERKEKGITKLTLKHRHPDRFIAEKLYDLDCTVKGKQKYEEDIGLPFVSRYSKSCTVVLRDRLRVPQSLDELTCCFPELPFNLDQPLVPVGPASILEVVYTGPKIQFTHRRATLALILWRIGPDLWPLSRGPNWLAELSFRYPLKNGKCDTVLAREAEKVFDNLGHELAHGFSNKTAEVYAFK